MSMEWNRNLYERIRAAADRGAVHHALLLKMCIRDRPLADRPAQAVTKHLIPEWPQMPQYLAGRENQEMCIRDRDKPTRLRSSTLGPGFDPEDIRAVIAGERPIPELPKEGPPPPRRVDPVSYTHLVSMWGTG